MTRSFKITVPIAGHALIENHNGLVVGSVTTRASGYVERLAALALIEPHAERAQPISLGADNAHNSAGFVTELCEKAVTPLVAQTRAGARWMPCPIPVRRDHVLLDR
jgi:hypothetical protein